MARGADSAEQQGGVLSLPRTLLNWVLAFSLALSPVTGMSDVQSPPLPDGNSVSGVEDDDLETLDQALQDEYQALLKMGYMPSEADQILRSEFEKHGCNGDVAIKAINRESSLEDQFDPEKKRTKKFLRETYQGVNFSARCSAAIEVARGIDSGAINQSNFLPEDMLAAMKADPDRMIAPWVVPALVWSYRAIAATRAAVYIYDKVDEHLNPDIEKLTQNHREATNELGLSAQRVVDEQRNYGEATGEARNRFEEAVKNYEKTREELEEKLEEVEDEKVAPAKEALGQKPDKDQEVPTVKEQSEESAPTSDPEQEIEKREKQKDPKKGDQTNISDVCEICAEREREAKWQEFQKQVLSDVNACLNRESVPDSPLTRTIMPRTGEADLAGAKSCDGKQLITSMHERSRDRAQRVCRFSVEKELECFQRIEEQRKRNLRQDFQETDGEILRVDCKLLTYPAQWHKHHEPLRSADDCLHLQMMLNPNSELQKAILARQDFMRPYLLLTGEKCYDAALEDEAPPRKDPRDPQTYIGTHGIDDPLRPKPKNPEINSDDFLEKGKELRRSSDPLAPTNPDAYTPAHLYIESDNEPNPRIRTVHVYGVGLNFYRYKLGPAPLNCSDPVGYSHEMPIWHEIQVVLFDYPNYVDYQICVVGGADNFMQPMEKATTYTWSSGTQEATSSSFGNETAETVAAPPPEPMSPFTEYAIKEYDRIMRNPKATPEEKCIARQKLQAAEELDERMLNGLSEEKGIPLPKQDESNSDRP